MMTQKQRADLVNQGGSSNFPDHSCTFLTVHIIDFEKFKGAEIYHSLIHHRGRLPTQRFWMKQSTLGKDKRIVEGP